MTTSTSTLKIINLTPHALNFFLPAGEKVNILPAAIPARCDEEISKGRERAELLGIPLISRKLGNISGLPKPTGWPVVYVVSLAVAAKAWAIGRDDVLAIGESVRGPDGKIIGACSLGESPCGFSFLDTGGNRVGPFGDLLGGEECE